MSPSIKAGVQGIRSRGSCAPLNTGIVSAAHVDEFNVLLGDKALRPWVEVNMNVLLWEMYCNAVKNRSIATKLVRCLRVMRASCFIIQRFHDIESTPNVPGTPSSRPRTLGRGRSFDVRPRTGGHLTPAGRLPISRRLQ